VGVRIVHFIKWLRLRDGGTVRAVLDMCAGLASRGHEVTALSADDSGVPESWKAGAALMLPRNLCLRLADPLFERRGRTMDQATRDTLTQYLPKDSMRLARQLLKKTDVLHVHGAWANVNHQLISAARSLGVPYVISPHGMLDDWSMAQGALKKRLHLALVSGRNLNRARAIHCTAQAERDQALKWLSPARESKGAVTVPLLFDTAPMLALPGDALAKAAFAAARSEHPKLLFLSRLNVKKGVEPLLHVAARLNQRSPVEILLAGPADPPEYLAHLQQVAQSLGISHRVHFLGMVTGDLKWSLYQASDLFVLPTSQENFGYVLLEALACSTPILTTTGVDIWPELEASGGATIIRGTGESFIPQLAESLQGLLGDAARLEQMGRTGREWALRFLDRETILDAMEAMYRPIT